MRMVKVFAMMGLAVSVLFPQTVGDNTNVGVTAFWQRDTVDNIPVLDHRGLVAGEDVDGDGVLEVWASHYSSGGGVVGFEMVNDSTLEIIFLDTTGAGNTANGTRWVQIGDLDGDTHQEVIFFAGRYASTEPEAGLYIYESTGNNTFADPVFFGVNSLGFLFNGMANLNELRVEHFLVDDVDGDDQEELIFATNGSSYLTDYIDTVIVGTDTTYDTYGHSEDFFGILHATGDLQSGFGAIEPEFATSARDIDMGSVDTSSAMFGRDNRLGGGSAINVQIADTDGDGLKELILHSWNYFNTTIVEATGPDTYSFGDTTYVRFSYPADHVCLKNATVANVDGDSKDEVYLPNYSTGGVYQIKDADDDATNFAETDMFVILADTATVILPSDTVGLNGLFGCASGDIDQDGKVDIYVGTSVAYGGYDIVDLEYDAGEWTAYVLTTDSLANVIPDPGDPPLSMALDVADLDGDGHDEIIVGYQGTMADSIQHIDGTDTTTIANPHAWWTLRVLEWDPITGQVSATAMRVITPNHYQLGAAYPNPFNPTTSIEYTLPLRTEISLTVYNMLGQEVVRLVDKELKDAGTHRVIWNGRNVKGVEVASGTYIYVLKFGEFQKSHRVTFLK